MAGAPTKYSQEIVDKARYYLEHYEKLGRQIPSMAGLALYLGVHRETLRLWGLDEEKDEFFGILDNIQAKQEEVLIDKGLNSDFNSNIVKLVLGKHGYSEKVETFGPNGGPVEHIWEVVDAPKRKNDHKTPVQEEYK